MRAFFFTLCSFVSSVLLLFFLEARCFDTTFHLEFYGLAAFFMVTRDETALSGNV